MVEPKAKPRLAIFRVLIVGLVVAAVCWAGKNTFWPGPGLVEVVAFPPQAPVAPVPSADLQAAPVEAVAPGTTPRFDVVRISRGGQGIIAGQAQPGAEIVVFDGTTEVARTTADAGGAFVALPTEPLKPGSRELTLASHSEGHGDIKGEGMAVIVGPDLPAVSQAVKVESVPEAPPIAATREAGDGGAPAIVGGPDKPASASPGERVVVQRGQSLWQLARSAYGRGLHYTDLYSANRDQIRNPRLIYPGQTLSVPAVLPPGP